MAGVLKRAGHQVVSFSNLPQAQQAYQAGGFDLVVCDGTLKHDGDGYEWAESLHAQGQKVIMLSGNKPQSGIPWVPKSNFNDKPIHRLLK